MSCCCFFQEEDELLECNICGDLQPDVTHMRAHKMIAHSSNSDEFGPLFYCDVCDRVFRSRNGRRDHMVSAHGVAPTRRYRVSALTNRRRKEGGQFPCHLCGVTNATRATLRNHMVIMHHAKLNTEETRRRRPGRTRREPEHS